MPEGHLIHHLARSHRALLSGRPVSVGSPQGRFAEEAGRLDGRTLRSVDATGKHLFYEWAEDAVVHVHLGMQGRFLPLDPGAGGVPHARMRVVGPGGGFDLVAPRRCDLVTARQRAEVQAALGPDPIARPDAMPSALRRGRRPIGAVLLDQSVVAGVGNAIRAEALFLAGIHPARPAESLGDGEARRLWDVVVEVMLRGAEEGRIATVRDAAGRAPEAEGEARYVYKQPRCRRCGAPVETLEIGGRTAYACRDEQDAGQWAAARTGHQ